MVDEETKGKSVFLVGDRARYGVKLANIKNSIKSGS
jgi:hypothetical protein